MSGAERPAAPPSDPGQDLRGEEVHVWLVNPDEVREPALLRAYREVLGEEERRRYARIRVEHRQHLFLVAHALVRATLSRYAGVAPGAWTFAANAHGRPEIAGPRAGPRFNLSHTEGLVACAVTRRADVGVDVESLARRRVNLRVAERFFSAPECEALSRLEPGQRRRRFLELWTLKEAYIKARGLGLALPLGSFAFSFTEGARPHIRFLEDDADHSSSWCFELRPWQGTHLLSVAVRAPAAKARIRYRVSKPFAAIGA